MKEQMDIRPRFYDRNSKPLGVEKYAELLSNELYRIVMQEPVGDLWVSTMWLGIDHQWFDGPPLIFETMVFDDKGGAVAQDRYSTLEQAKKGHRQMVQRARDGEL